MQSFPPDSPGDLPPLCGDEARVAEATSSTAPVFLPDSGIPFSSLRSAFAVALHMHQPLIPAGTDHLPTAPVISNLQFMMEHPEMPDAHNAPVFKWCYVRMAEFIPQLLRENCQPRIMLDYSGCLLYGLRHMGAGDVIDRLRPLAQDPTLRRCVEWLGTTWGHAVAPSTPVQDFRLHVRAWQHHFASIFGFEALSRVRGFSPPEMALPNHPDVAYEFVKTLNECGYRWVLLQEQSVERVEDGKPLLYPHLPHRLVARNTHGETQTITALIKTRPSDVHLLAQMQPYHEAMTLAPITLGRTTVPPLVTQISDGENGGVMMNEFPPMFLRTMHQSSGTQTPPITGTEYLEHLHASGVHESDFPLVQPIHQHKIWQNFKPGQGGGKLESVIQDLRKEDKQFHVDGASWTNNVSWVRGYENVLGPMEAASALFAEKAKSGFSPAHPQYNNALFHLLSSQTSCYRYWGQGAWTNYGKELCRRTMEILEKT
jgi:hypothetical protein